MDFYRFAEKSAPTAKRSTTAYITKNYDVYYKLVNTASKFPQKRPDTGYPRVWPLAFFPEKNAVQLRIISAIWKAISKDCSAFRRGSQVVR